jgi:hypothetical protein
MGEAVKRITTALGPSNALDYDLYSATIRKSFVLSVDQAHAVHPNYCEFLLLLQLLKNHSFMMIMTIMIILRVLYYYNIYDHDTTKTNHCLLYVSCIFELYAIY